MIIKAMEHLRSQGFEKIYADHVDGYGQPREVNGSTPDISAYKYGQKTICEIEITESISADETQQQFQAFASSSYPFRAYVEEDAVQSLKENLNNWGIPEGRVKIYFFK